MKRLLILIILSLIIIGFLPLNAQMKHLSEAQMDEMLEMCMDSINSPDFMEIEAAASKAVNENNYVSGIVDASKLKMFYYYLNGNTDSLEKYTDICLNTCKQYESYPDYFSSWVYLLNHYTMIGKDISALTGAKAMQEEALKIGSHYGIGSSSSILGDVYTYMGLYDEALQNYYLAISELKKEVNKDYFGDLSNLYFLISVVDIFSEKYEDAILACDEIDLCADEDEKLKHNPSNIAYHLVAMCSRTIAYSKLGQHKIAAFTLKEAKKLYTERSTHTEYFLEAEATYLEAVGRYEEAINVNNKIIKLYDDIGMAKEKNRFIYTNALLYEKTGNYVKACSNYDAFIKNVKALNTAESFNRVNEYSVINNLSAVELEKKDLELSVIKQKNDNIIILTVLLFIIFVATIVFLVREYRLNNKLKIAVKEAKRSDMLKSAFLANMSHEIRTPLNAIVGFSDLIAETDDKEEQMQYKNIIKMNSSQLIKLVNDILDLSKIDAGIIRVKRAHFDIVPFFNDLYKSLSSLPEKKPDVAFLIDNPYKSLFVDIDKSRLAQIITNFITNAFKFTTKGEVKMGYTIKDKGIYFYVSDTGKGIPKDKKDKVFERFYKVDDFTIGNGLGMAISKAIVDTGNARIGVDSEEGKGSTFWLWISQE